MYENVYMHLGAVVPSKKVMTEKLLLNLQPPTLKEIAQKTPSLMIRITYLESK